MQLEVEIIADTSPILGFLKLLKSRAEFTNGSLSLSDLGFELVRTQQNIDAADASKITITFYPSDAFLGYVGAVVASDRDLEGVE